MNFTEDREITGHLQIAKHHKDGAEEIVFDDHNVITSGMGVGLSYFFTGSGSGKITDYHFDRFQVGVSGAIVQAAVDAGQAGIPLSAVFQLSGPLERTTDYGGAASKLVLSTNSKFAGTPAATIQTGKVFAYIPFSHVTRIGDRSVRWTIVLDEQACISGNIESIGGVSQFSSKPINEIGLFMGNPRGLATDTSLLVAYRTFSDITKTDDFSLVFRWTINF